MEDSDNFQPITVRAEHNPPIPDAHPKGRTLFCAGVEGSHVKAA
jgi:hypothetical protein